MPDGEAPGSVVAVQEEQNAGTSQASQAFWQADDIEREVAALRFEKHDLPTMDERGISTDGGAKAAWFKHNEGNILALIQLI